MTTVKKQIAPIMIIVITGVLIYSNVIKVPFYFDDTVRIQNNKFVRVDELTLKKIEDAAFKKPALSGRPISNISFAINYYFHQYIVDGYHIVNIVIHILTGIFLFSFLAVTLNLSNRLTVSPNSSKVTIKPGYVALFAALLWFTNPLHTSSVTYIIQRMNSLAAMFYIFSFLLYVKARILQTSTINLTKRLTKLKVHLLFTSSFVTWLLSLCCKQTAPLFPFFVILYEFYFFQNLNKEWLKKYFKYFLVLLFFLSIVVVISLTNGHLIQNLSRFRDFANNEFTYLQRVLTQPRVMLYYITLFLFPHPSRLKLDYDYPLFFSPFNPSTTLVAIFTILFLMNFSLYVAKKDRLISFCILWFFGNLLVESSVIPLAIIWEYRTYVPSMFLGLLIVILIGRYSKTKLSFIFIISAVVLMNSGWTYKKNDLWNNKVAFWMDNVNKTPHKARPHYQLAHAFSKQEKMDNASFYYNKTLLLNPKHYKAHNNLGVALEKKGDIAKAIAHFKKSIKIAPSYVDPYNNLGNIMVGNEKLNKAIELFNTALIYEPNNENTHFNLAVALEKMNSPDMAIKHYLEALRIKPFFPQAHNNLGGIFLKKNKISSALFHFKEAVRIDPEFIKAKENLENLSEAIDRINKEIIIIEEKKKNDDQNANLYYLLGRLFFEKGESDQAANQFKKAITLHSSHPQALVSLATIQSEHNNYDLAISLLKQVVEQDPHNAKIYYNISCLYAKEKKVHESISWLAKAIEKGYVNLEQITTDQDLEHIRNTAAYKRLIQSLSKQKKDLIHELEYDTEKK